MTRPNSTGDLQYDSEIEKTSRRLRKEAKQKKQLSTTATTLPELPATTLPSEDTTVLELSESSGEFEPEEEMTDQRTLRELATPPINQPPLCIKYLALEVAFEL